MAKNRAHGEGTITQRKDGSWQGQLSLGTTADGKRRRKTVYGSTKQEVREKLEQLKRTVADGTYSDTRPVVSDYLDRWLNEKARTLKASTLEEYKRCVHQHIIPRVGSIKLDKLTPLQAQTLVGEIADHSGASTANKSRVVLLSAYRQAIRWKLVAVNPVDAVDPLPEQKRDMKLWTPQQGQVFLATAEEHRLFAFFYLAMSTGLRRGELLGLRWQDVTRNALLIRETRVKVKGKLQVETPKTSKGTRRVTISPDVLTVLGNHRKRLESEREDSWPQTYRDLVFLSEAGTPMNPDNLRRLQNSLMDKAGVPRVRLHDLRHLHGSVCINNGMDPKALAERLGHSRASFTLDRYVHLFDEQREKEAVSINDWLSTASDESENG
jgi:integrase